MKRMSIALLLLLILTSASARAATPAVAAPAKAGILEHAESANLPSAYRAQKTLDQLGMRAERMQTLNSLIGDWWVYFWEEDGGTVVRVYVWPDGGADREPVVSLDVLTPGVWSRMPGLIPFL